jgi:hypothetical protein
VHSGGLTNSTVEMCFVTVVWLVACYGLHRCAGARSCTPTWPASLLAMGLVYVQGGAAAEYLLLDRGMHGWLAMMLSSNLLRWRG